MSSLLALRICRVEASNLKNVEALAKLGDKNDVYVMLSYGGKSSLSKEWNARTTTLWEAGDHASWDYAPEDNDWLIDVTRQELMTETLKIVVMDENKRASDTLIGETEIPLSTLLERNSTSDVVLQDIIKGKTGKVRGLIQLTCTLSDQVPMKGPTVTVAIPTTTTESITPTTSPSETPSVSSAPRTSIVSRMTAVAASATRRTSIEEKSPSTPSTTPSITTEPPIKSEETMKPSHTEDTHSSRMAAMAASSPLGAIATHMTPTTESLKPDLSGFSLFSKSKNFTSAALCVRSVSASDMPNMESSIASTMKGDKNDVYAKFSMGGKEFPVSPWCPRTNTLDNTGATAAWEFDEHDHKWMVDITKEQLLSESIRVVFMEENHHRADKLIGKAEFPLKRLVEHGINGKPIEFEAKLQNTSIKKDAGHMKMTLCLAPATGNTNATIIPEKEYNVLPKSNKTDHINLGITVAAVGACTYWGVSFIRSMIKGRGFDVIGATFNALSVTAFLALFGHRIFGYLVGLILRKVLSDKVAKDKHAYNITIGWMSFRGLFDRQEVVLHDVVFRNHPSFVKSPYLLHLKELAVSLNFLDLYNLIYNKGPLIFERVILESLDIYFEKSDTSSAKYEQNIFAATGITDESGAVYAMIKVISDKIKEKMDPLHVIRPKKAVPIDPVTGESTEFKMEIKRLLIFDILAHPLDLLSATHMEPTASTDIILPAIIMQHKDLTKEPKTPGGPRLAVTGEEFGDLIGNKIAQVLFGHNSVNIANMLSAVAKNKARKKKSD